MLVVTPSNNIVFFFLLFLRFTTARVVSLSLQAVNVLIYQRKFLSLNLFPQNRSLEMAWLPHLTSTASLLLGPVPRWWHPSIPSVRVTEQTELKILLRPVQFSGEIKLLGMFLFPRPRTEDINKKASIRENLRQKVMYALCWMLFQR